MIFANSGPLPHGTTSGSATVTSTAAAHVSAAIHPCFQLVRQIHVSEAGPLAAGLESIVRIASLIYPPQASRLTVMRSANSFGSVVGSSTFTSFRSSDVIRIWSISAWPMGWLW